MQYKVTILIIKTFIIHYIEEKNYSREAVMKRSRLSTTREVYMKYGEGTSALAEDS